MPDPDVRANTPATVVPGESPASGAFGRLDPDWLAVGEETMHRRLVIVTSAATGTGNLRLAYFTARKSETVTQVRMWTGGTAAAATPTLCRIGVYSVAANGDLALVAATANDVTLFAAANTAYTRALTASFAKVAGQRYAIGPLIVTAAAAPTVLGNGLWGSTPAELGAAPRLAGVLSSQADLPTTALAASVGDTGNFHYAVLLP